MTAYLEQCEVVETAGAKVILMASRALAASANHSDDYEQVYDSILTKVSRPVILHWLGAMFDPALDGYWGSPRPRSGRRDLSEDHRRTRRKN